MKKFNIIKILLTLLLITNALQAAAQDNLPAPKVKNIEVPQKVLFVGNSFSYFNNGIANHFSNLVRAAGHWKNGQTRSRLKTISGGKLAEHIAGVDSLLSQSAKSQWDVVILQEYSNGPISKTHRDSFKQASTSLAKMIRQYGATPVFFMTWAYKGDEGMTQELAQAYVEQGNALNMLVVPVGLAFQNVVAQLPELDLYSKDVQGFDSQGQTQYRQVEKHPSMAGTYLAACVFYAALYHQSPQGLAYTAGLSDKVAANLQKVAWQTVQSFYR
ncbi:hypothetical protein [Neptunicella sp. SCSIO 80796]|uniref:hypothetical protein n=1 Tax=Neptunicella plasticusilytica TaxID=3117012 RepID=UPI003A4D20F7